MSTTRQYTTTNGNNEPIAIIGSGCRFPGGAHTPARLWEELKAPRDLLGEVPKNRFNIDSFWRPDGGGQGRSNTRHTRIRYPKTPTPLRLILETVYEGIASAGLKVEELAGSSTAVYVGVMGHDFEDNIVSDLNDVPAHAGLGLSTSIVSNRVSYFFDWHGPSVCDDHEPTVHCVVMVD
ncbi:hypothetical protein G6O67_002257 [Ophiocordyceps sinensis]|uniref:Ketosynthase family 3 (KS3) domain-containing protein n=1 Tax=Ophiocordyceps sinensis TaxID=72228 RepID=A0A8H4PTX2_9HYPO|nr:hypothetical protein G6O67_002257 [Ophiocordyceps sinensis]